MFGHDEECFVVSGDEELYVERNGIPAFRLSRYFREHAKAHSSAAKNPLEYYTTDGMHTTSEGSRAAAQALKAIIESTPQHRRRR